VLSREFVDVPLFNGRIDGEKAEQFCGSSLTSLPSMKRLFADRKQ
jgi:hypothetical protein